jgi:hypothetical protein
VIVMANLPQILTLVEVARMFSVSPHTIRSWVRASRLNPVRISRKLLFRSDELERFLCASQSTKMSAVRHAAKGEQWVISEDHPDTGTPVNAHATSEKGIEHAIQDGGRSPAPREPAAERRENT